MSSFSENKILDGKYEILDHIGSGGMAYVYKGRNIETGEFVAIKVLKREYCDKEKAIKQFNNEARAVRNLDHPNIVKILDLGNVGNVHYIAREYIEGVTLEDYIKTHPIISWQETFKIIKQVLSAVECAHSQHVIHRDIKPMNILLCDDGIAKLSDFGIAKAVSSDTIEATKNSVGSVHYISPEHARGGFVDERSDIYSIGVTMYEMIVGTVPFDGDSHVAIAIKHLSGKFVQPHDADNSIPMGVNDVIVRALMKDPGLRFQSAADMLRTIEKVEKEPGTPFLDHEDKNENGIDDETEKVMGTVKTAAAAGAVVSSDEEIDEELAKLIEGDGKDSKNLEGVTKAMGSTRHSVDDKSSDVDIEVKSRQELPAETEDEKAEREKQEEKSEKSRLLKERIFKIITYVSAAVLSVAAVIFIVSAVKNAADRSFMLSKATYTIGEYTGYEAVPIVEMLEKENIEVKQELVIDDNYLGAGFIISQDVEAGKTLRKGDKVTFKVSALEGSFMVTDCVGMKGDEAEKTIKDLGLECEIIKVKNNKAEKGTVTRMLPVGGSVVTKENKIKLYVSEGKLYEEATVPNLIGMTLQEAKSAIEAAGLVMGKSYPNPGQDVTYIINPTPSPSPSPIPSPEPSEEPTPEFTDGPLPSPTGEAFLPTAEPSPVPAPMAKKNIYASNKVQYQFPPAGTVIYGNESVDVYFYDITKTGEDALRSYRSISFNNPASPDKKSITFTVYAYPYDVSRKIMMYNKTIYKTIFPVQIKIPESNTGGTDVLVYADNKLCYKYLCE